MRKCDAPGVTGAVTVFAPEAVWQLRGRVAVTWLQAFAVELLRG